MSDYDVIVVGGRASGSTLAARLGLAGLRVLLLERAHMPVLPGASCPIIYAAAMNLLDEIGADESAYARDTPKIRRMIIETVGMESTVWIPMLNGRDYAYAIDRARFDYALWQTATALPTVDGRMGASLLDLIWDGERVTGALIKDADGIQTRVTSDLVVGADGRFSTVARKVGAPERDEHDDFPASIYYAYWTNVAPYDDLGAAAVAGGPGYGYGYLMMDSADGSVALGFEGQAALLDPPPGETEAFYRAMIAKHPTLLRRLQGAEMITSVRGMKAIGNLYRQPGGMGWALTGDAYHQKDPLDGQGVYDALLTSKLLAEQIVAHRHDGRLWSEALVAYDQNARRATFAMYNATVERSRVSLYARTPEWLKIPMRWMLQDPVMQERFGLMLTRQVDLSDTRAAIPTVLGAIARGPLRDLSRLLDRMAQ
ncbi:MAG: NAD(P)/FAD-dependent oxidoreductase [Chloroflexota bacterium]|nr:NAD(P)/FAD-dependent oxidoreductase [Chloroflexota bacterium]